MAPRFSSRLYLHVIGPSWDLGGWQFRFESCALFSLRDAVTHEVVAQLPEALVVAALAHYVGAAALTRELLPRLPALPPRPGPGPLDVGQPRLRGASARRLRGRKGPQATTSRGGPLRVIPGKRAVSGAAG